MIKVVVGIFCLHVIENDDFLMDAFLHLIHVVCHVLQYMIEFYACNQIRLLKFLKHGLGAVLMMECVPPRRSAFDCSTFLLLLLLWCLFLFVQTAL